MELQKNKKRAARRKRNVIAREMRMNKAQHEKRIEPKRKRQKVRLRDVDIKYYTGQSDLDPGTTKYIGRGKDRSRSE